MAKIPVEFKITSIVCYPRRSRQDVEKEKRTGEDTLTEQITLMERVLNDYGVPYVTKPEIGSGDKISTRPVFQEVLKDLEKGLYDAIAVKEISRLGRGSYTDMGLIYDLLDSKRIFIITPWKIYDPKNPADKRQIRFELFMSREEFETTRERLQGARYNYAMSGKWMTGSVPFGYKINSSTQKLMIDEEAAKTIRLIFDLYINGLNNKDVSFRSIATYLKRLGIPTPKGKSEWYPLQIQRVILNPAYIGQVNYRISQFINGKRVMRPEDEWIVVDDSHEPIIDKDIWDKAQHKYENRGKVPRNQLDFSPCELASLFVCKKCGRKMVRQYSVQNYKKKDGEMSKYHKEFLWCTTSNCSFVKYRDAESQLLGSLQELVDLEKDEFTNKISRIIENHKSKKEIVNRDELIKQIDDRKKQLKSRLDFIYEKYEKGIYTDEEFIERKNTILDEIKDTEKIIIPEEKNDTDKIYVDVDKIKNNIKSVLDMYYKITDKTDKNRLLRGVFDYIELEILRKGRGRKSATFDITGFLRYDFLV